MQNGYGYGQQSYPVYEESWGSENEHHGHHQVAEPVMDYPPNFSKHQTMPNRSQTMYHEDDYGLRSDKRHHDHGYNSEKMHHSDGWNGSNTHYGYFVPPTNARMGANVPTFQGTGKMLPYGRRQPGSVMMDASEHDVYYKVNGPSHLKSGGFRPSCDDGYGYQSVEWESKAL